MFRDHRGSIDSALVLFMFAQALATDAHTIVDVGCGRGAMIDAFTGERRMHDLRAPGRQVIGIDVDDGAAENPLLDEFRLIENRRWPLADGAADLVLCDWVLEHIEDPPSFVAELTRVLRPGGVFLARTISRYSVLAWGARVVPNRAHARVLARLQPSRADRDVFPTVYRMNTRRDLARLLSPGFDWTTSYHPGLEQYALKRPRIAAQIAALEPRLPKPLHMVMIVTARKR
jgi:SAM-dependent methyltransferase